MEGLIAVIVVKSFMTVWLLRETNLFYFYIGPVPDLVHGKSDADGISFIVKLNFSERGVSAVCAEGLPYLLVIRGAGVLDGVEQRLRCRIAVEVECARLGAVCFLVRFYGGNG